jgi:hypothetical protein
MENYFYNIIFPKHIQISEGVYKIPHPCLLSNSKILNVGELLWIISPNSCEQVTYFARLLDVWQEGEGNIFLEVWNFDKRKKEVYSQNLKQESCLFLFLPLSSITEMLRELSF